MAGWKDVDRDAPEFARKVLAIFEANKHKTIATLRRDGAPRVSGIELDFWDGDAWLGSMPGSRKSADLKRDPRFSLHSATVDPDLADGDAKLSGRAVLVDADQRERYVEHLRATRDEVPEGDFDLFRVDVQGLSVVSIGDPPDHLVVESWHEGRGLSRIERQ